MSVDEADQLNRMVRLGDVIKLLASVDFGYLQGSEFVENKKPYHGPCCCCQTCGRCYDDCVCGHNELLAALLLLGEKST